MTDKLTTRGIPGLPIPDLPDGQRDYPDGRVPGLVLRVFGDGSRSWYLEYQLHGRQRRYELGDFPAVGLALARKRAKQMRADPLRPSWKYNRITAALAKAFLWRRSRNLEKVVFVATTGRTGTMTLARLFDALDGVVAYHEPFPIMNGRVLASASDGEAEYCARAYRTMKSVHIRRLAAGARYYVEANHLFIKTFADHALDEFGSKMGVIHLVRDPVEVANSMYQLEWSDVGTFQGDYWWLDFRAPTNIIDIREDLEDGARFGDPFSRSLWYWYEVEARVRAWRAAHPSVPVVDIRTNQLSDPEAVVIMLRALGIEYDRKQVEQVCGQRFHRKLRLKSRPPLDMEVARSRHEEFLTLLARKGHLQPT